ncbi:MAG TPA: tetratricopeptide repeat protein [Acidobacteriota bacterium]|nr:tetratricopeptide repeat protein [Acidobacteriota bacterium]
MCTAVAAPRELALEPEILQQLDPGVREEITSRAIACRTLAENVRSCAEVGAFLHANGFADRAVPWYALAAEREPGQFAWWYYLGVSADTAGDVQRAEEAYRKALECDDGYVPLLLRLGDLLSRTGRFEESLSFYDTVLQRFPAMAEAHYGKGRMLEELGDPEGAREAFQKACELFPAYGSAHFALARLLRDSSPTEAQQHLAAYRKYQRTRPGLRDHYMVELDRFAAGTRAVLQRLQEAVALGENGRLEESVRVHKEVLAQAPSLMQTYANLIILYSRMGQYEETDAIYRKGLAVSSDSDALHYNYGVALLQQQRLEEADKAFHEAVQINPFNAQAWVNLGQLAERRGDLQEAEACYRRAIEAQADFRQASFHLARVKIARSDLEGAREILLSIVDPEDEESARYWFALAAVSVRQGRIQDAWEEAERARELARRYDQKELLSAIERDLQRLPTAQEHTPR